MSGSKLVQLDKRRRVSLAKIGRHSRYLIREESDGTLIFVPVEIVRLENHGTS